VIFVITVVTSVSLLLIRQQLQAQVTNDLANDLTHSVLAFQDIQSERQNALERENDLLADLPSLKALMTTSNDLTIQDGGEEFWKVSGNDLLALANNEGRVVAVYSKGAPPGPAIRRDLNQLLSAPKARYLITGNRLFVCSVQPITFGDAASGTLLGYVISGVAAEERVVHQISQPSLVDATFLSNGRTLSSTLTASLQAQLAVQARFLSDTPQKPVEVKLGEAQYLAATEDLSPAATAPLQLIVLKSFAPAEERIRRIDHLVLLAGLLALLLGTALMIVLSRAVTRPLEELSLGVRAFGAGDGRRHVPRHGTQEVRELSSVFASMRQEIQQANRALLESERLATIGRMASSVSHDLRHYLAAVYANAEFLASESLSPRERAEIFADVRSAVHGTTEMIESLLIFSRTGNTARRTPEWMANLVDRAVTIMRAHPDAEGVKLIFVHGDPKDTVVLADGKQIERAVCNLLLNACQSARISAQAPKVEARLDVHDRFLVLTVTDNGAGVPEIVRDSLFQPFVSDGKQKGTGLGLTLAHCVAVEHGGDVILLSSRPGETIFQLKIVHELGIQPPASKDDHDKVLAT
jgi:signal transduction histidine kinase